MNKLTIGNTYLIIVISHDNVRMIYMIFQYCFNKSEWGSTNIKKGDIIMKFYI